MEKPSIDIEIERALRNNDDALAQELMRERDARRPTPRPPVRAVAKSDRPQRAAGSSGH